MSNNESHSKLRQDFIDKYNVKVISPNEISFRMYDHRPISLLQETQALALELYDISAIDPEWGMKAWLQYPDFIEKYSIDKTLLIRTNLKGSARKSRSEHRKLLRKLRLEMPKEHELAAAFCAYGIATGKSFFRDFAVRAYPYPLASFANGLGVFAYTDEASGSSREGIVVASSIEFI